MKPYVVAAAVLAAMTAGVSIFQMESASANSFSEAASRVAVVGDSLAWQADLSIQSELAGAGYVARVSVNPGHALSSAWAQQTLSADTSDGSYGIIVLETASNDAAQLARGAVSITRYSQLLEQLIAQAGSSTVVIVNAKVDAPFYYPQSDAVAINRAMDEAAVGQSNVRIVDWNGEAHNHPSWFGPDMLHLSPGLPATVVAEDPPGAGAQDAADRAFAQAIVDGVERSSS